MDVEQAIADQSERHHKAMADIGTVLASIQADQRKTYELLAGSFERPGLVHRIASMEAWRQDSPKRWAMERGTRVVDAILVAVVLTLGALAIRAFIVDAVRQISDGTSYQRDQLADLSTQEK